MTTEIASPMHKRAYKYKFSILVAIVFPCLCRLVLQGSDVEHELSRYLVAMLIGALTGYLIDSLPDKWRQSLTLSRKNKSKLKEKEQEQRLREARYVAMFEKNNCILILIDRATGRIEEANPSACFFYGYSLEQLRQMHISALTTLSREKISYEIDQAQSEGRKKLFFTHILATGEERDVEVFSGSIDIEGTAALLWVVSAGRDRKGLQGIIPICAHCKQIRANAGEWSQIEEYIQRRAEVTFSHGLCPTCAHRHYPTIYELQENG